MKKQIVSIFAYSILGLSAVMVSCGGDASKSKSADTENVAVDMASLKVDIDGMTCAVGCAKTIEKMLSETEGVTSAKVDYEKKAAFIEYDKNKVSEADLIKSITEFKEGAYKAAVSTKTKEVKEKVNSTKKSISNTVDKIDATKAKTINTIDAAKSKTIDVVNDGRKTLNNNVKAVSTKSGKAITGGKEAVSNTTKKVLNTGTTIVNDAKTKGTKSINTAKKTLNTATENGATKIKSASDKEMSNAKKLLGK